MTKLPTTGDHRLLKTTYIGLYTNHKPHINKTKNQHHKSNHTVRRIAHR
jgi:hypothetical protein